MTIQIWAQNLIMIEIWDCDQHPADRKPPPLPPLLLLIYGTWSSGTTNFILFYFILFLHGALGVFLFSGYIIFDTDNIMNCMGPNDKYNLAPPPSHVTALPRSPLRWCAEHDIRVPPIFFARSVWSIVVQWLYYLRHLQHYEPDGSGRLGDGVRGAISRCY